MPDDLLPYQNMLFLNNSIFTEINKNGSSTCRPSHGRNLAKSKDRPIEKSSLQMLIQKTNRNTGFCYMKVICERYMYEYAREIKSTISSY